jgi:transposase InsO family protein
MYLLGKTLQSKGGDDMTQAEKIVRAKMSLLELAEYLKNVSQACRMNGVSRQHFYDIKRAYDEGGMEALRERSRRKSNHKNRVAPEVEAEVVNMGIEFPAYGQLRASNELKKRAILISPAGVRSVWMRHGLETKKKRLARLEEKAAQEGIVYTEAQLAALEQNHRERESCPDEIETHHPGYLLAQDTMYVGYIKGVGRIYQQSVIDTYSSVAFAKVYDNKTPVTAADALNDRVLPFFEEHEVMAQRMLTDRGTEFCGRDDSHHYELFLAMNEIEHTRTKARHPQTNGICERFHQTCQEEFYKIAFRKKIFRGLEDLQRDLDSFMDHYNNERTHQGKRCQGRTPMMTFNDGLHLALEKQIRPPSAQAAAENGPVTSSSEAAACWGGQEASIG